MTAIDFDVDLAFRLVRANYRLAQDDQDSVVESARNRYDGLPSGEQDGEIEWVINAEANRLIDSRREES